MTQIQKISQPIINKHDELILVVRRDLLLESEQWHGVKTINFEEYLARIEKYKEFLPRSIMEQDENYKQIIPYLVFEHNEHLFLMQRKSTASEQRLKDKLSIGIGGHIRAEDLDGASSIVDWATREFHEEVAFDGTFTVEPIGIINDDTNMVGKVHIGFVYLLRGSHNTITIRDEHKSGTMTHIDALAHHYDRMESWSQMTFDAIKRSISSQQ